MRDPDPRGNALAERQFRFPGRAFVAGLALIGVLATGACHASAGGSNAKTPTMPSATGNCPPAPTIATLDAMAQKAMDPNTPAAELLKMVQGMDFVDPEPIDEALQQARQQSPQINFTTQITGVVDNCTTASAQGTLSVNGRHPMQLSVPFVYDHENWKIERSYFCGLLAQAADQAPSEYQEQIQQNQGRIKQMTGC